MSNRIQTMADSRPPLPSRPIPHERDGRQSTPPAPRPGHPHLTLAVLLGVLALVVSVDPGTEPAAAHHLAEAQKAAEAAEAARRAAEAARQNGGQQ
ncbi:hypothetical protein ACFY1A_48235 [Streptomyces sp. NPDC001520]|uniref:hypothetical protein n=1 Tax=Streptomyces sp. NPDC001520 TaxID=3364581 RepID=UPI0036BE63CD